MKIKNLSRNLILTLVLLAAACGSAHATPLLGDYVWLDSNGDGIQDANETGLSGVDVYLYSSQGDLLTQTQSDRQGWFGFNKLASGEYYLIFDAPADYRLTLQDQGDDDLLDSDADPNTGQTAVFTLSASVKDPSRDVGFVPVSGGETGPTATPTETPPPEESPTPKQVITLTPSEDTFVYETQTGPLWEDESYWLYGSSKVYMRFPLDEVPKGIDIPSAILKLYIHPSSHAFGHMIQIQTSSPDSNWSQDSLVFGNQPNLDLDAPQVETPAAEYSGPDSQDSLDVTALVNYALQHGYSYLDLVLSTNDWGELSQEWYSTKSDKSPMLLVDP